MFGKLKGELQHEIDGVKVYKRKYEEANKELIKQIEEFKKQNIVLEEKNNDLNERIMELDKQITSSKIRDVLRTLEYNKLKGVRLHLNSQEEKMLDSHRDVIKDNKGKEIYGLRIVKDSDVKNRAFIIEIENKAFRKK